MLHLHPPLSGSAAFSVGDMASTWRISVSKAGAMLLFVCAEMSAADDVRTLHIEYACTFAEVSMCVTLFCAAHAAASCVDTFRSDSKSCQDHVL